MKTLYRGCPRTIHSLIIHFEQPRAVKHALAHAVLQSKDNLTTPLIRFKIDIECNNLFLHIASHVLLEE